MRKRSSYRPKPVFNPLLRMQNVNGVRVNGRAAVVESMIHLYTSLEAIIDGHGIAQHVQHLVTALNIAEGFIATEGEEHEGDFGLVIDAQQAMRALIKRSQSLDGRFVFKAEEISIARAGIAIHARQMKTASCGALDKAMGYVDNYFKSHKKEALAC